MSYSSLSEPKQITTRKAHRCGWCNEVIPKGTSDIWARSYVLDGDPPCSDWMHPECWDAMNSFAPGKLDEWMPGDFGRGKTE